MNNDTINAQSTKLLLDNILSIQAPIMIHVLDDQGRLIEVNQYWLEKMGYALDQVIGRRILEFIAPSSQEKAARDLATMSTRKVFTSLKREFLTATGTIIEVEVEARAVRDENVGVERFIGIAVDVTERNQRERELRAREEELRTLLEYSPDGIMIHTDGKYVYVNTRACAILGARDASELLGKDALDVIAPHWREIVRQRIAQIGASQSQSRPAETQFVRLDGEIVDVELTGASVVFQGKRSIQVVFRDISDRKRADAIAQENAAQHEIIRAQQEALLTISTPLLPLREHVVLMPLVGAMNREVGERATETLLQGIGQHGARVAILDVTGVPEIGPEMADALRRTIYAAQLLGAEVVVTGIQAAIARTMIDLGLDMSGIMTRSTLREGIAYAFRRVRQG